MTGVEIKGYAEDLIRSFSDWDRYAMPPNRKLKHWKEGRSAYELARIWTANGRPRVPAELTRMLESHHATKRMVIRSGITERETSLPFGNRGPRCHDLALLGDRDGSTVTICIEAKADESFGGTVAAELLKARKRPTKGPSKFPDRLGWLTRSLLGLVAFEDEDRTILADVVGTLPYQLFAATAGTLLEAELGKASMAVLVVHEFRTNCTRDDKMERNTNALNAFLRFLLDRNGVAEKGFRLESGRVFGPVPIIDRTVAGTRKLPSHIPLFFGKIRTTVCEPTKEG